MENSKVWKVYYSGYFSKGEKGEHCCKEIKVEKKVIWNEEKWYIPSVYTSSKGLVIDFCKEITVEKIQQFKEKWNLENWDITEVPKEFWEEFETENPFNDDMNVQAFVNGKELLCGHGCKTVWCPNLPEEVQGETESENVILHYGLSLKTGWIVLRQTFKWGTKKSVIHSIKLCLSDYPKTIGIQRFSAEKEGDRVALRHPITKEEHLLTVLEINSGELDNTNFPEKEMVWPTYYKEMKYTLTPDLPRSKFMVQDCAESDRPISKIERKNKGEVSVAVIGGGDGPTAIFLAGKSKGRYHTGLSSLHFKPVEKVEWKIGFQEKMREDIEIEILF